MTPTQPASSRLAAARRAILLGAATIGLFACAAPPPAPLTYVVFFSPWSADLDDPAKGVINDAATAAKAAPGRSVIVQGYADQTGTPEANQILSRLRAQQVADALSSRGVDRSRIVQRPRGATGGDPGVESRRVEVNIGS